MSTLPPSSPLPTPSPTSPPENPPGSPPKSPGDPRRSPEEEEDEEWGVPWSDEEEEGAEPEGGWQPEPQEIRRLYEGIASAGVLPLSSAPFPRREPSPEPAADSRDSQEAAGAPELQPQEAPPVPTEFDFDDDPVAPNPSLIDRRRTPGWAGRAPKREARLDKVLSDMKRHKRLEEQILRTGQDLFPPDSPQPPAPKRAPGLLLRHRKY